MKITIKREQRPNLFEALPSVSNLRKAKHFLLYILFASATLAASGQNTPAWITKRPVELAYYTGIGRAPMTGNTPGDYLQVAKQNALADLVSEINVNVSQNSLLFQLDMEDEVKSAFQDNIRLEAKETLEKFDLVDTWNDGSTYWVYYRLSKADYNEYMAQRRARCTRQGYDCWVKGEQAMTRGDLMPGVELFVRGLEAIRPCINEELTCSHGGRTINVGNELFASLKSAFAGIAITPLQEVVYGKVFQGINEGVSLSVTRDGAPLRNLKLQIRFAVGEGRVPADVTTGNDGEASFFIQNISSKLQHQELHITVDPQPLDVLKKTEYASSLRTMMEQIPRGVVYIEVEQAAVNAWVKAEAQSDAGIVRAVRSMLANNYFNLVESPTQADVTVSVGSAVQKGGKVDGDMYDFTEYMGRVTLKIIDNADQSEMLNYSIEGQRTVVPESTSEAAAKSSASRDLLKKMNRELPAILKNMHINLE